MMSTGISLGSDSGGLMMGNSGDMSEEINSDFYGTIPHNRPRLPGLYVGNLTWWTTDQDVIDAINSLGVTDVQEVKFFENRNNGQSRGFCVVTFSSDNNLSLVKDRLPKIELHGQKPLVAPYTRQNLSLFEGANKTTRPQLNSNNVGQTHAAGIMGISSISGVHAAAQNLPFSNMNTFNQGGNMGGMNMGGGGGGGPRGPGGFGMMRPMRGPRPGMRGHMQNAMSNGPMSLSGPGTHMQMPRNRYPPPPSWGENSQTIRHDDVTSSRHEENRNIRHDEIRNSRYEDGGGGRPSRHEDGRSSSSKLLDGRSTSRDRTSSRDRSRREDSSLRDDRPSARKEDTHSSSSSSRRADRGSPSRRDRRSSSSSRRVERSSSSRREDRSSRREEKSSSRRDRDRHHRSRSRDRSRHRDRDRERDRDKKDRY